MSNWVVVVEDSDPIVIGPFGSEDAAIEYARENWDGFARNVAVVRAPSEFEDEIDD